MTWPTKTTMESYNAGSTKMERRFAFWPIKIDGFYVWLQFYEVMQYWQILTYQIDAKNAAYISKWIDISKRIVKK